MPELNPRTKKKKNINGTYCDVCFSLKWNGRKWLKLEINCGSFWKMLTFYLKAIAESIIMAKDLTWKLPEFLSKIHTSYSWRLEAVKRWINKLLRKCYRYVACLFWDEAVTQRQTFPTVSPEEWRLLHMQVFSFPSLFRCSGTVV